MNVLHQGITRAISDQSRTIRLPVHVYDTLSKIRKARLVLDRGVGGAEGVAEDPSDAAIAHYIGIPEAKVRQVLQSAMPMMDLDGAEYAHNDGKDNKETAKVHLHTISSLSFYTPEVCQTCNCNQE